jgi:hypothetical protein
MESLLPEMATATDGVAISRGPWPEANKPDGFEFLFDDGSPNPFTLHALPEIRSLAG